MHEIRFRGKRIDNGEWLYGYYFQGFTGISYILVLHDHILGMTEFYEVDPATVGQYTGLKDKNGREIWEGDIIHNGYGDFGVIKIGEFIDHNLEDKESNADCSIYGVYIEYSDGTDYFDTVYTPEWVEVIGNIHDNPLEVTP